MALAIAGLALLALGINGSGFNVAGGNTLAPAVPVYSECYADDFASDSIATEFWNDEGDDGDGQGTMGSWSISGGTLAPSHVSNPTVITAAVSTLSDSMGITFKRTTNATGEAGVFLRAADRDFNGSDDRYLVNIWADGTVRWHQNVFPQTFNGIYTTGTGHLGALANGEYLTAVVHGSSPTVLKVWAHGTSQPADCDTTDADQNCGYGPPDFTTSSSSNQVTGQYYGGLYSYGGTTHEFDDFSLFNVSTTDCNSVGIAARDNFAVDNSGSLWVNASSTFTSWNTGWTVSGGDAATPSSGNTHSSATWQTAVGSTRQFCQFESPDADADPFEWGCAMRMADAQLNSEGEYYYFATYYPSSNWLSLCRAVHTTSGNGIQNCAQNSTPSVEHTAGDCYTLMIDGTGTGTTLYGWSHGADCPDADPDPMQADLGYGTATHTLTVSGTPEGSLDTGTYIGFHCWQNSPGVCNLESWKAGSQSWYR